MSSQAHNKNFEVKKKANDRPNPNHRTAAAAINGCKSYRNTKKIHCTVRMHTTPEAMKLLLSRKKIRKQRHYSSIL